MMFKKYRIVVSIAIGMMLFSTLSLTSCKKKQQEKVIKIGAILPLTGNLGFYGEQIKQGIDLATAYINSKYSVKLEVVYEDNMGLPKNSINALKQLKSRGIHYIYTTLSPIALTLKPIVKKDSTLIMFADCASPSITEDAINIYRHSNTALEEGGLIADFLKEKGWAKNIMLLYQNNDYGKAFEDILRQRLSNVYSVSVEQYPDYQKINALVRNKKPSAIVIVYAGKKLLLLYNKLREVTDIPIVSALGLKLVKDYIDNPVNLYYTDYALNREDTLLLRITEGKEISDFAILSMNSIMLFYKGIIKSGGNVRDFEKYITQQDTIVGIGEVMKVQGHDIIPYLEIKKLEHK